MSIHGNQYVLPFFVRKDSKKPPINDNDELSLAFYLLTKDLKEEEKVLCFGRLLWPFLSIQGVISTHILLDGLYIFNKKDKYTNPPRQPLIGHIIRNVDSRSQIEQINKIIDILTYKDKDAEEIGAGEESEYHTLQIDSLVNPEFLGSLSSLLNIIENKPIIDYMALDSSLTSDKALTIAEKYRNIVDAMKGNALRWETVSGLVNDEINKWLTDLTVKLKDIDERYSSQITKTTSTIDHSKIQKTLELERDKIDQWKVGEKKRVIGNISLLFKTAERTLEDILKKNRFFTADTTLITKVFEDLLPSFESHFTFLKTKTSEFLDLIDKLKIQYEDLKVQGVRIDSEAIAKIEELEASLHLELKDRNQQLSSFEKEKTDNIEGLMNLRDQIEELNEKVNKIIQTKRMNCLSEADTLVKWSIKDTQNELFSKPMQWIYMPLYAMFIEDEDMMEERIAVVLPGYVGDDPASLYNTMESFNDLRETLIERVDDDMKIRSNFEFSCESKNIIRDPNFSKKIMKGISILRSKGLTDDGIENTMREKLKKIQE